MKRQTHHALPTLQQSHYSQPQRRDETHNAYRRAARRTLERRDRRAGRARVGAIDALGNEARGARAWGRRDPRHVLADDASQRTLHVRLQGAERRRVRLRLEDGVDYADREAQIGKDGTGAREGVDLRVCYDAVANRLEEVVDNGLGHHGLYEALDVGGERGGVGGVGGDNGSELTGDDTFDGCESGEVCFGTDHGVENREEAGDIGEDGGRGGEREVNGVGLDGGDEVIAEGGDGGVGSEAVEEVDHVVGEGAGCRSGCSSGGGGAAGRGDGVGTEEEGGEEGESGEDGGLHVWSCWLVVGRTDANKITPRDATSECGAKKW